MAVVYVVVVIVGYLGSPMCIGGNLILIGIYVVPIVIGIGKIGVNKIGLLLAVIGYYAITSGSFAQAVCTAGVVGGDGGRVY